MDPFTDIKGSKWVDKDQQKICLLSSVLCSLHASKKKSRNPMGVPPVGAETLYGLGCLIVISIRVDSILLSRLPRSFLLRPNLRSGSRVSPVKERDPGS